MNNSLYPKYYLAVDGYGGGGDTTPVYTPPATTYTSATTRDKSIYKLNIFKDVDGYVTRDIPPSGGFREIEILGTPGAMFSLTIDKGDGCSALTNPINNVTIPEGSGKIGKYSFVQRFPPTTSERTYDIQLTPSADVKLGVSIPTTTPTYSIKQYVNPLVTFTNKATIAVDIPTATTIRGAVGTYASSNLNYATSTKSTSDDYGDVSISWTIDKTASGYLYVKKQPTLSDWSSNVEVTKNSYRQEGDRIKIEPHTVNIEENMHFTGAVSISKVLISSEDVTDCKKPSSSLVLNNADDLEVGMIVIGDDINRSVYITAVDEGCKKITISSEEVIRYGSILTFTKRYYGVVEEVIDNNYIKIVTPIKLFTKTTLMFNKGTPTIIRSNLLSTSGATTVVISGTVKVLQFGIENVTFTQDLDNIITYTPNAFDQTVTVVRGTATTIDLFATDTDENYRVKTPSVVTSPQHAASLSGTFDGPGIGAVVYTPTAGYIGPDLFTFKVNDGTTDSDTKTIYITVK